MTDKIVVFSSCESREEAEKIGRVLVEGELAACVNVIPGVQSIYRWQGKLENTAEWMLMIKTRRELFDRLTAELRRIHSYQVPEAIAVPVVDGSAEYLHWIDRETNLDER